MDEHLRIAWQPISPLADSRFSTNGALAAVDALRHEWEAGWRTFSPEERIAIRQRSLRRLAIETGIIERLYDIDWGLTLNLVAEGFARDVVERHGGQLDDRTRLTLEAQRDSLNMVLDFVSDGRNLSPSFIKELHAAITRTQDSYEARDALGRAASVRLDHGAWKTQPNHVLLSDGRLLEYCPPEHVASEIERLVELHRENESHGHHPIICAAWLHHRFVQIHPFSDGNGRVARALVLLVLQKHHFAPLVVDRFHRDKYILALNDAKAGDLAPLIRLFANLESAALANELERPAELERGTSTEIARSLADQLKGLRRAQESKRSEQLRLRAIAVSKHIETWFEAKQRELDDLFRSRGLTDLKVHGARSELGQKAPIWDWFRAQVIKAAHRAGHYADFGPEYSGWVGFHIRRDDLLLRYIAALHGAGQKSGVLAVVTLAELVWSGVDEEGNPLKERQQVETTADAFRVVHTESIEAINSRDNELHELLDEGLSVALVAFFSRIS